MVEWLLRAIEGGGVFLWVVLFLALLNVVCLVHQYRNRHTRDITALLWALSSSVVASGLLGTCHTVSMGLLPWGYEFDRSTLMIFISHSFIPLKLSLTLFIVLALATGVLQTTIGSRTTDRA